MRLWTNLCPQVLELVPRMQSRKQSCSHVYRWSLASVGTMQVTQASSHGPSSMAQSSCSLHLCSLTPGTIPTRGDSPTSTLASGSQGWQAGGCDDSGIVWTFCFTASGRTGPVLCASYSCSWTPEFQRNSWELSRHEMATWATLHPEAPRSSSPRLSFKVANLEGHFAKLSPEAHITDTEAKTRGLKLWHSHI